MLTSVFIFLFIACTLIQLAYWVLIFSRLNRHHQVDNPARPFVSVVICAKNALYHLQNNIRAILNQDYPAFEVVVVDDGSEDGSWAFLDALQEDYHHLQPVQIDEADRIYKGKKKALETGIRNASGQWLLHTDADCKPKGKDWITTMVSALTPDARIVLGFAPFYKKKGLVNALARYECWMTAVQYLSWANVGIPYMGVGRNLMYHKSVFSEAGGFDAHLDLVSGDDDLLVNATAKNRNVAICLDQKAFMYSEAKTTWRAFLRQKMRHLSTSFKYQPAHQAMLALFSGSLILFYISFFVLLFQWPWEMLSFYVVITGIKGIFAWDLSERLGHHEIRKWYGLYEIAYVAYLLIMAPVIFLKPATSWN